MSAVEATIEETREIISLMEEEAIKKGKPIGNLDRYVSIVADNDHLPGWLARVRAARRAATPTPVPPPVHEVLAAARGPEVPRPRGDDPPPPVEEVLAALRQKFPSRPKAEPERILAPPPDPAVEADRAYLASLGNFDVWWTAACQELPTDAHRDDITRLAAKLARNG
jgi:hypothetical protein